MIIQLQDRGQEFRMVDFTLFEIFTFESTNRIGTINTHFCIYWALIGWRLKFNLRSIQLAIFGFFLLLWGTSSIGRVIASHVIGTGIETLVLHIFVFYTKCSRVDKLVSLFWPPRHCLRISILAMDLKLMHLQKLPGYQLEQDPNFKITVQGFYFINGGWVSPKQNPFTIKVLTNIANCNVKSMTTKQQVKSFVMELTAKFAIASSDRFEPSKLDQCDSTKKATGDVGIKTIVPGETVFRSIRYQKS